MVTELGQQRQHHADDSDDGVPELRSLGGKTSGLGIPVVMSGIVFLVHGVHSNVPMCN